ncbi:MAG: hypothetical protein KAH04_03745 [Psychrilyobacter sp.]|nr:hypothetical protein [Psychrilyobacter sp.]
MRNKILILLVLVFIGCSNTPKEEPKLIFKEKMIQLKVIGLSDEILGENSKITFKIWGYDVLLADVKATLLEEYTYDLVKLPVTYGLDTKKKLDEVIKLEEMGRYGYYITIEADNGNGKVFEIDREASKEYLEGRKKNVKELSGEIVLKEK